MKTYKIEISKEKITSPNIIDTNILSIIIKFINKNENIIKLNIEYTYSNHNIFGYIEYKQKDNIDNKINRYIHLFIYNKKTKRLHTPKFNYEIEILLKTILLSIK